MQACSPARLTIFCAIFMRLFKINDLDQKFMACTVLSTCLSLSNGGKSGQARMGTEHTAVVALRSPGLPVFCADRLLLI